MNKLKASHSISDRIQALRAVMQQAAVQACFIPSADPHLSEYLPEHWQARAWLSGFGGSAGSLLVTADFAGLWTDSRYWVQAESDLRDSGVTLMRQGDTGVLDPLPWVEATLAEGDVVAIDGNVLSMQSFEAWSRLIESGMRLETSLDLPGQIWDQRPALPHEPVYEHALEYAIESRAQKLQQVREEMVALDVGGHLISSLDDIAWLLNLRGGDVPYNPVFLAHFWLDADQAILYVASGKVPVALEKTLRADGVELREYSQVAVDLASLPEDLSVLVDPQRVTVGTLFAAPQVQWLQALNPSQTLKAIKSSEAIAHIRRAMEHDGAALCEFFAWFDRTVRERAITELEVDEELTAKRAAKPGFVSPSFGTIAAFGPNGAMPHYQATEHSYAAIEGNGLLLIDSGGQYWGGTTDITRVVPVGQISAEEKRDFTLVLKGMIQLSQAVFPVGVTGQQLDVLARQPLWREGLEFGHGTGHGVGYFLNVHEGPQSISWRGRPAKPVAMKPGMVTSNEPGLYRAGKWGIRIENLVVAQPALSTEFGYFLRFETLTLCPIDTRCIERSLLTQDEVQWLNSYHAEVRERLSPLLQAEALAWLQEQTQALL
ncbi:aminopeptidase P family protein [Paenalcaligenes suwonensis]|uniref:aminopeptidase P family protein n=1 Tax=Paenalcaligenes suwonensis TaxID=1202713 RepID=UPI00140B4337|nr:aminopeptidase P family protein [Paenalcaligenes suwonensis]NHC61265.1 aminopeptidase P family protein [Paenalcaligenes suwonensis]